jgi:hypothetical protein
MTFEGAKVAFWVVCGRSDCNDGIRWDMLGNEEPGLLLALAGFAASVLALGSLVETPIALFDVALLNVNIGTISSGDGSMFVLGIGNKLRDLI